MAGARSLGIADRHPGTTRPVALLVYAAAARRAVTRAWSGRRRAREPTTGPTFHYNKRRGGQLIPNYVCVGRGRLFGDPLCQSIMGTAIDAAVGALLDRLLHHAHVLRCGPRSWRMQEHASRHAAEVAG